jgi:hypothetical protein
VAQDLLSQRVRGDDLHLEFVLMLAVKIAEDWKDARPEYLRFQSGFDFRKS